MSNYLLSLLLGIVEGITEFLPISSTAHLRIVESLVGISLKDDYWKMYTVVIQLGAILSVLVYFRQRIIEFLKTFPKGKTGDRNIFTHPLTLTLIAFVVTAGPAWYLKKKVIDKNLESLWVIGTALMVGGVVMWAVDVIFRKPRTLNMEQMSLPQAIWVGAIQILSAVFPGTSRSMSTIAAGQTAGMSREAALEFSFFLCIPTMIAATAFELRDTLKESGQAATGAVATVQHSLHLTVDQWVVLAIGFAVSFVVAYAVIALFMRWVRDHGFVPFAIWRIAVGVCVLAFM